MEKFDFREFDIADGSEESLISDTDIFKSIRPPTSKRKRYHKKLVGIIVFASFMLATANFVNYEAMMRSKAYLNQIDIAQKRYPPLPRATVKMKEGRGRHLRKRPRYRGKRENNETVLMQATSIVLLCKEEVNGLTKTGKVLNGENLEGSQTRRCKCNKKRVMIHDNKRYTQCLCEQGNDKNMIQKQSFQSEEIFPPSNQTKMKIE